MENSTLERPTHLVEFNGYNCLLEMHHYIVNDRRCIQLIDAKTNEYYITATVNLPDEHLEPDEVFIKNFSENEGIMNVLSEAGIISKPIGSSSVYGIMVYKCKMLV